MKAYKRTNLDGTCNGFKYPEGEWVEFPEAKLCECGAHSCLNPLDTNKYYNPANSVLHEVEIEDVSDERGDDSKVVSKRLKLGAALNVAGICKAHFEYVNEHCNPVDGRVGGDHEAVSVGDKASASAGESGSASAGESGSASAGESGSASAGWYGSASAGEYGSASAGKSGSASAGEFGSASAGEYGSASAGKSGSAVSRGKSSVGKNGIACARGNNCKVRGGMGAVLVLGEEGQDDCELVAWKAVVVDGITVKPDTWYMLKDGDFVEAEGKE